MRDEARNTLSHHSWANSANLRQRPVTFVSAGFTEPLRDLRLSENHPSKLNIPEDETLEVEGNSLQFDAAGQLTLEPGVSAEVALDTEPKQHVPALEVSAERVAHESAVDLELLVNAPASSALFYFDLTGNKSMLTAKNTLEVTPVSRSRTTDDSDSSEEIILFRGRSGGSHVNPATRKRDHVRLRSHEADEVDQLCEHPSTGSAPQPQISSRRLSSSAHAQNKESSHLHTGTANSDQDDEDAILADYIANMAEDSENDLTPQQLRSFNNQRDLGGDDGAFGFDSTGGQMLRRHEDTSEAENSDSDVDDGEGEDDTDSEMDEDTISRLLSSPRNNRATSSATAPYASRPSATSVADALDDLDITDWTQSRIGRKGKGKGRKQPPSFNVSDSDLETALRKAWERDRERKKSRKLEREAVRAKGLLGKNVKPDDLRVKYQSGMTLDDIKHELVEFLLDSAETYVVSVSILEYLHSQPDTTQYPVPPDG